ncbi:MULTISPECIES: hypothetical protein [Micromonospora]|uniref:hypothetical protein n=1 Tax=Micromonospora TaxID=1873 RepID=UPI001E5E0698|nr:MULTISPECIES: hypothetical protein [unclassified Micromonospora]MDI5940348.1 hypothetical protein [Micromonospora sp. DH15]
MNVSRARLLACAVMPFLAACGPGASGPAEAAAPVTYTCCEAQDVDKSYQAGETLTVHWTVESPEQPGAASTGFELTARLTGPFTTAGDLKAATEDTRIIPGLVTFEAVPIRPSGVPDERPVSTIVIGVDARPGYYNLVTSSGDGDKTVSGGSIVQVVARP